MDIVYREISFGIRARDTRKRHATQRRIAMIAMDTHQHIWHRIEVLSVIYPTRHSQCVHIVTRREGIDIALKRYLLVIVTYGGTEVYGVGCRVQQILVEDNRHGLTDRLNVWWSELRRRDHHILLYISQLYILIKLHLYALGIKTQGAVHR